MTDQLDDPRDRGLCPDITPAPRPPLTEHQRGAHIAAALGIDDDEAARRRRALRVRCPRETCTALPANGCRVRVRGVYRPLSGTHAERLEAAEDLEGEPLDA